ncbi:hypothetical protein CAPTEDRAFT_211934 [Capitella teleta]|uniref:Uncharacterized protein n=1 Tax=Capitella teleta TaxID=283909 RepID=R7V065_CAPTE|nr:hypothetical protein CAPTEDRAFT_211934 [Capitella teleta]|eukprot:ELU12218.1 hypothetical protein CAPTEDRAFT_211934 [Capitella teleta]
MSVDKFGRPSGAVDKFGRPASDGGGPSLTYMNNHFLRRDGLNSATNPINMGGHTLIDLRKPVNPHDSATKNYVDVNLGGGESKVDKSGDTMTGDLNMGGNHVTNLAEGVSDDQAVPLSQVNKMLNTAVGVAIRESIHYTDEEAVKKSGDTMTGNLMLSNGSRKIGQEDLANGQSFQISMGTIFNRIFCEHFPDDPNKETPVTVWGSDGFKVQVGGTDVIRIGSNDNTNIDVHNNKITNIAEPTNTQDATTKAYVDSRKPVVAVWAEENGPITSRIIRGSLASTAGTQIPSNMNVLIVKNGVVEPNYSITKDLGMRSGTVTFSTPLELSEGDRINFKSNSSNSLVTGSIVSVLIELDL